MSLRKKIELSDLKARNTRLSNELATANKSILKAAVEIMSRDFQSFFKRVGFTVTVNSSAFSSSGQGDIDASHGNLKATLTSNTSSGDYNNFFIIKSNINKGTSEYNVGVYTAPPKSVENPTPLNPLIKRSEDEQLEQDIKKAQADLEYTQSFIDMIGDTKHIFSVSWQNSIKETQANARHESFDTILEAIFG